MASLRLLVVLIVFFAPKSFSQTSPTITYISQQQIKDVGGTADLSCSVQNTDNYPVVWMKADKQGSFSLPISTGSSLILHDSRYSLRYDTESSTYTLQIRNIQESDAGSYFCQILISSSNRVSAEVELQVRRPPYVADNSTRSVVASQGDTVELECYADGYPLPHVIWRRDNNALLPSGGATYSGHKLKIRNVKKEDRGTYVCMAENGVGRGTTRNIVVEVEFGPIVKVPRPRTGQALEYDMDMECHVEAYPPPAIIWIKDNVTLTTNEQYRISHLATANDVTRTTLRARTIEQRQYGKYVCKAVNKLGTAEGALELFESVVAVCPPACGETNIGGTSQFTTSTTMILLCVCLAIRNFNA